MIETPENSPEILESRSKIYTTLSWLGVIILIYLLIAATGLISTGFATSAGKQAQELFEFARNPFAGLLVGTLCTALIQSSSTVTSIIVGLVAGGLPVAIAIPMVMGSNIGTTITNTIVSLGHVKNTDEFQKAFAAATIHDFFNLISVIIFLPLELATHFLEKFGLFLADFLVGRELINIENFNPIQATTQPLIILIENSTHILPSPLDGIALVLVGIGLIFLAIFYLGKLLKILMIDKAKNMLHLALGKGAISGMLSGTLVTMLVQSSSTTTSLIVPLAGNGLLTLEEIYPFTLGANIGTCITALLAATAVVTNQVAALEIAMVHLLYNLLGTITIYGIPFLRNTPIWSAKNLAKIASDRKYLAIIYIIATFFFLPATLLIFTKNL
ncbi:Na+/phosphate symporter [Xenococcus sp. PCC 7305]|uniref:Na/Pi symporter n=1 Tax=Xenococcus sp. PCC 7305 TaxID=102125 RepID=UPI0002AD008E|nr:Na/Pi symporter [Xenococcus sp. PCC 7305]ELS03620.1 Na+/phosphate symporter [Xenococcus sp. PCC 7305]